MAFSPSVRIRWPIVAIGALVIVAILLLRGCGEDSPGARPVGAFASDTVTMRDTVWRERRDTVRVDRIVTRPVYRERKLVALVDSSAGRADTLLVCNPFRAPFDTTLPSGARVRGVQVYEDEPPRLGLADLEVSTAPDSVPEVSRTLVVTNTVREGPPWYEEGAKALLYASAGYLVRYLTEPDPSPIYVDRSRPPDANPATFKVSFAVDF
jgi:hypothetical protein